MLQRCVRHYAAPGYPGDYPKGQNITGLPEAAARPFIRVLHAGTKRDGERVLTAGGRVLGVTAIGETVDEVAERVYAAVECIDFPGVQYRRDIGHHARRRP